jgi:hypothetical protein
MNRHAKRNSRPVAYHPAVEAAREKVRSPDEADVILLAQVHEDLPDGKRFQSIVENP